MYSIIISKTRTIIFFFFYSIICYNKSLEQKQHQTTKWIYTWFHVTQTHQSRFPIHNKCQHHRAPEWNSYWTFWLWTWPTPAGSNRLRHTGPRRHRRAGHCGTARHGRSRGTSARWRPGLRSGYRDSPAVHCKDTHTQTLISHLLVKMNHIFHI